MEKCKDHINNGSYQLLKKDPTGNIKAKTLKQLKALKDNLLFIDNKLCYHLKPTDLPAHTFYGQPNIHKPGLLIYPNVSCSGSLLCNLNKYIANILKAYVKNESNNTNNSSTFFQQHHKCSHSNLENFFHHINNPHQNIKSTMEEESNGELAFLDIY